MNREPAHRGITRPVHLEHWRSSRDDRIRSRGAGLLRHGGITRRSRNTHGKPSSASGTTRANVRCSKLSRSRLTQRAKKSPVYQAGPTAREQHPPPRRPRRENHRRLSASDARFMENIPYFGKRSSALSPQTWPGLRYRPAGTISATVPPGARNLIGTTPGSLMISHPYFRISSTYLSRSSTSTAK